MEFFSKVYCTWTSLMKQSAANMSSLCTTTMKNVCFSETMKIFAPLDRSAPGTQGGYETFCLCPWWWWQVTVSFELSFLPVCCEVGLPLALTCSFYLPWAENARLVPVVSTRADQPPSKGLNNWIHPSGVWSGDLMALTLYVWKCSYSQLSVVWWTLLDKPPRDGWDAAVYSSWSNWWNSYWSSQHRSH